MTKKMIMLPLLAASVSLFFTGCEGKLVEKVDLIPQAQSVTIGNGSFPCRNCAACRFLPNGTKRPRLLQNWYKKQPEFH